MEGRGFVEESLLFLEMRASEAIEGCVSAKGRFARAEGGSQIDARCDDAPGPAAKICASLTVCLDVLTLPRRKTRSCALTLGSFKPDKLLWANNACPVLPVCVEPVQSPAAVRLHRTSRAEHMISALHTP